MMMKTLLLLTFTAFCLIGMQNQEELPYKPFKEFNNDTIAFLEYNFHDRAKYYEGKTFEEVYKDLYFIFRNEENHFQFLILYI